MSLIPGVPFSDVPPTGSPNADLSVTAFPSLARISVIDLVGPDAANRQIKALEKRDETLRGYINSLLEAVNVVGTSFLQRDGGIQEGGTAGLTGDMPVNGFRFTGMAASTANGHAVEHSQLQSEITARSAADAALTAALALKAPLDSPALTGIPTAPTPTPNDNSTKIATTAYVDAAVTAVSIPGGDALLTGSGTFQVPAGVFSITAVIVGGGGAGGRNSDGSSGWGGSEGGGGGGRGGVRLRRIPVTPGQNISYACGLGGVNAAGTSTSFLGIVAPGGGKGGNAGSVVGVPGVNGDDDEHASLYIVDRPAGEGTPTASNPVVVDGVRTGQGAGYFIRRETDGLGVLQVIGQGGIGQVGYSPNQPGGGDPVPGTPGGLGCGGEGHHPMDTIANGGPGGDGFVYVTWGV